MSEVEILEPDEVIHVAAIAHPLSLDRRLMTVEAGPTIADLLREVGVPPWASVRVFLDGDLVYPEFYHVIRPKRGSHVVIRAVPRGGGQGGKVGGALGIVVGIILIIVGIVGLAAGGSGVGLIFSGALMVVGGLLSILIPPPSLPSRLRSLSGLSQNDAESPTLSISGQSNTARPYGIVPRVFGRYKIFPPYAALPFTEEVGSDQYLRLLFCVGLGVTQIDTLQLGDSPIANFQNVEVEVRTGAVGEPPLTLYTNDVFEDPLSVVLAGPDPTSGLVQPQIRTSKPTAIELSVSIAFPQGLVFVNATGAKVPTSVSINVAYRAVGQPGFIAAPAAEILTTEAKQGLVRAGLRWKPQRPAGPYDTTAWVQFGLGSFDGTKVNNLDLGTAAFTVDAAPVGAYIALIAPTPIEFGRVLVTTPAAAGVNNATWTIQWSDDQVVWSTVYAGFVTGAATQQSAEWGATGTHLYWRLLKTTGPLAGPAYTEVEWWATTAGQYDVRLTRNTPDSTDLNLLNLSVWTGLRSVSASPPVTLPAGTTAALVAMRIKATDQLNGVVSNFNCMASSPILDYATFAGTGLADAPLGYWRLGEILGAPTAFDASGAARAGVYRGSPTLGVAGLLVGDASTAMSCDGVDDGIDTFAGLSAIDMGGMSFSVEFIFTPAGISGDRDIVGKGTFQYTAGGSGWSLLQSGNVLRFARTTATFISVGIAAGTRYHVVATYSKVSGLAVLWLNGVATATASWTTASYFDSFDLRIAKGDYGFFAGTLQEVRIYPQVLSDARIAAHYAAAQGTREWIVQPTSNPASIYRSVLQDVGNARPVGDARMDIADLQRWHDECDAGQRSCNVVVDYKSSVYELLRTVAACGRGTPTMNDDRYSAVRDVAQTVPVQHFSERNSRNFVGHRALPDTIHALKMRFIDPSANWQQSERIVYDDGQSAATATKFEVIELIGVTDPDLAWRIGRYNLAVTRLRPESYTLETDVEFLVARRGDLVRIAHPVTEWGLASGRVKSVVASGGMATSVVVDEVCPMLAGSSYAARFRLSDGTSIPATLVTTAGDQTTLTFAAPIPAPIPAAGDFFMFGLQNLESVQAIVSRIVPGPEFSAVLTLVDAAPAVLTADQAAIPPWDPQMTRPAEIELLPPTPQITSVVSDESVLLRDLDGSLSSRILLTLSYTATSNVRADFVEVRFRRSDSSVPFDPLPALPPDVSSVSITGVEDGVAYDIRVRTVNRDGPTSPWTEVLGHVVIGKTSKPPAPTDLRIDAGYLKWEYASPPLDFSGFLLRRSPGSSGNFMTALPMHTGVLGASVFPVGTIYNVWTFMVAAIDTSGNESDPVSLTVDFGDPRIHNQIAINDYKAAGFPRSAPIQSSVLVRVTDSASMGLTEGHVAPLALSNVLVTQSATVAITESGVKVDVSTVTSAIAGTESEGVRLTESGAVLTATSIRSTDSLGVRATEAANVLTATLAKTTDSLAAGLTDTGVMIQRDIVKASSDSFTLGVMEHTVNQSGSVNVSGNLVADQRLTGFWTQDNNLFWSANPATLFWQGTYDQMIYDFTWTVPGNAAPSTLLFQITVSASGWALYYRVGGSGPFLLFPGALPGIISSQEYDFRLITDAGVIQGVVSQLTAILDATDILENQNSIAVAVTTGTRLTLSNTFRTLKTVQPTVVAFGAETAISARAQDKQATAGAANGPLIQALDAAGAVVAGHVDVALVGY